MKILQEIHMKYSFAKEELRKLRIENDRFKNEVQRLEEFSDKYYKNVDILGQ